MLKTLLYIGMGSFAGGIARYLLSKYMQCASHPAFPLGTLTVNVLGCLLIGIFYGLAERHHLLNNELRMFLTVGFCGGFTTFSTFIHENYSLFQSDHFLYVALYSILSLALGLGATYLGHFFIKMVS